MSDVLAKLLQGAGQQSHAEQQSHAGQKSGMEQKGQRWRQIQQGRQTQSTYFYIFSERFGKIAVFWTEREGFEAELVRIIIRQDLIGILPQASCRTQGSFRNESSLPEELMPYIAFIHSLLDTDKPAVGGIAGDGAARFVFPLDQIPLRLCTPFQRRTLEQEHRTPPGTVTTYARLAAASGQPSAARAVAASLSHNPFPLLIPCHRTVRSDGSLGGYQGGLAMKRWLLEQEGVPFLKSGKIDLNSVSFKS